MRDGTGQLRRRTRGDHPLGSSADWSSRSRNLLAVAVSRDQDSLNTLRHPIVGNGAAGPQFIVHEGFAASVVEKHDLYRNGAPVPDIDHRVVVQRASKEQDTQEQTGEPWWASHPSEHTHVLQLRPAHRMLGTMIAPA